MLSEKHRALLPDDYLMHDSMAEFEKHIELANAWLAAYREATFGIPNLENNENKE